MAQEIEAKFYVRRLDEVRQRLETLRAELVEPRVSESNLRFDTQAGEFRQSGRVLRLRQDTRARLTYKDSDRADAGALHRREVEFAVSDFKAAQEFLEALGYVVVFRYEKFRTTYKLEGVEIMLDEMPYGQFVEIEGETMRLHPIAERLGLKWEHSIRQSYSGLFDTVRGRRRLPFGDLTFENFRDVPVAPTDLGVKPAD